MKFDADHLDAAERVLGPDVIDLIVGDPAEGGTQAAADSSLLAIEDCVVSHDAVA